MISKKSGPTHPRSQRGKSIALFTFAAFALFGFIPAIGAQPPQTPAAQPPQQADSGPSLTVTMQFIQDKLKAKLKSYRPNLPASMSEQDIVADPAACLLKFRYQSDLPLFPGGKSDTTHEGYVSIPFRDIEKIEVMTTRQYANQTGNDDDAETCCFILKLSMTTNTSVTRHMHGYCKKQGQHCIYDADTGKKTETWDKEDHAGFWTGWFDDADTPNRIAKAMNRAAERCGAGKAEPF